METPDNNEVEDECSNLDGGDESEVSSGNSIATIGRATSRREQKRLAPKGLRQYGQYMYVMEDRVRDLERRPDTFENVREVEYAPPVEIVRVPATPELNYVEWHDFKKLARRRLALKDHYAIDVLRGPPVYYHHQRKKGLASQTSEDIKVANDFPELPERIRINSIPLLRILGTLLEEPYIGDLPIVMLRPFEALLYYEKALKMEFARLATKWSVSTDRSVSHENASAISLEDGTDIESKVSTAVPSTTVSKIEHYSHLTYSAAQPAEEQVDPLESIEALKDLECLVSFVDKTKKAINTIIQRLDDEK